MRPLPVLCAGMALLSFARVQPVTPADGALAICMLLTLVGPLRFRPTMPTGPAVALTLFTLGTVLSMIEARDTAVAISFELHTLFFILLAVWLTSVLRTNGWTRAAVRWYIVGAIASAALGVLAWVVHFPGSDLFIYLNGRRVQGLYLDPNAFGPYLVPAAVICLEEIMRPRLLRWRPSLVVGSFLVLVLGIVLSFSRAAVANLALACVVLVLVYALRRCAHFLVGSRLRQTRVLDQASVRRIHTHRGNVVVLAGTVSAEPVERRMPSGDEVTGRQDSRPPRPPVLPIWRFPGGPERAGLRFAFRLFERSLGDSTEEGAPRDRERQNAGCGRRGGRRGSG